MGERLKSVIPKGEIPQMPKNFVSVPQLLNRLESSNIAVDLDKDKLLQITNRCIQDYDIDEQARKEWMDRSKESLELAMQTAEAKNDPWPNAANVKYPSLTIAALQFHARAYPSIIRGTQVVKGQVTGFDPDGTKADRAMRIGKFMSWQCLEDMDGWEEDVDRLLLCLPILGCMFKKTAFDFNTKKNRSEMIFPQNLCIPYKAKSMLTASRMTFLFDLYPQEIIERQMQGVYLDEEIAMGGDIDIEKPQEMLEQHCLIDLDQDGYKEPYIATIHKASSTMMRLVPNYAKDTILVKVGDDLVTVYDLEMAGETDFTHYKLAKIKPVEYFTKFSFFPSPDGGIYDFGFGQILYPLIEAVNTLIDQMLDAATKQNYGGGFMTKNFLGKRGDNIFQLGEFKEIENMTAQSLRDCIYEFQHTGPSPVSFNLLNLLLQSVKDITTVQDIMVGDNQTEETATTTLARVDQGQKLFTAIYKRLYRSLKSEFKKLKRLNRFYLPVNQYFTVLDTGTQEQVTLDDFKGDDTDVQPVADPQIASLPMKLTKAQVLRQASAEKPQFYNQLAIERRFLEAIEEPNIDEILLKEEQITPPPDPKLMESKAKIEELMAKISMMEEEKINLYADTMKKLADAKAVEAGIDQNQASIELEQFKAEHEAIKTALEVMQNGMSSQQGGNGDMEGQPPNETSSGGDIQVPPELAGVVGAGVQPGPEQPGENGTENGEVAGGM
jgi:chaperonin GroES